MAARKRSSRSTARSKGKSASGSSGSTLALGAILALGGLGLWSAATHKSPDAALSALFHRPAPQRAAPAPVSAPAAPAESKPAAKDLAAAVGPVPRPSAPVAPAQPRPAAAPIRQALPVMAQAARPPHPAAPISSARLRNLMPPRGVNTPAHSPSVVYARTNLTIRKTAWDKAPAMGMVEKGREMRSYGKTGRWHRVVVPSTSLIGWVHEDQLIGGRDKPDSASLATGSIAKPAPKPHPLAASHPLPPRAVGAH